MADQRQSLGKRLFINRDFGLLFFGRLVSQVGDGIHYLALTWLVLDLTGSGAALGTMLFASSIPSVILAPFTGVLADLWDRKTIIVSMDILRGLILLSLAAVFKAGYLSMSILYVATILSSLCGVLFGPAISAAIPGLVKKEELVKANSLNNLSRAATMIVGPVLGALLLGTTGYFGVFTINGIAFLLSAFSEVFIRFPEVTQLESQAEAESSQGNVFLRSFKEGFAYIWQNAGLRSLIFFAVGLNFLGAPLFNVVLPYLGKEVLGLQPEHFGTVQASLPVGFLIGTILIGYLTKRFKKENLLASGIIFQGVVGVLLGLLALPLFYENLSLGFILLFLSFGMVIIGILNTLVNVPFQVMMQETVPDHFRGRVNGLLDSLVQMLVPISMALAGVLIDGFSIAGILILSSTLTSLLGFGLAASSEIKELYTAKTEA